MLALLALLAVSAVWGLTFVQVKDAVAVFPLFAFLTFRFLIATAVLAVPARRRVGSMGRSGAGAATLLGTLLAAGYALQTAGLERSSVSAAGFVTGMYVVLTPVWGRLLFDVRTPRRVWTSIALATAGLALLSSVGAGGTPAGNALVLAGAAAYALQIALLERYAPRYDPFAFTLVQMLAACVGLGVVALALGELSVPHGRTVWAALVVTGVFASAFAFLVQTWAQRRTSATRVALAFSSEPVFAALFGFALAGDRLDATAWLACGVIMVAILLAEPAAADVLRRLVPRAAPP